MDSEKKDAGKQFSLSEKTIGNDSPCLYDDQVDTAMRAMKAAQCYQRREFEEAERICRDILNADPSHAGSLHLMGLLALEAGKEDMAAEWMRKAVESDPKDPCYYGNLGCTLQGLEKLEEAVSCYQEALKLQPENAALYFNMGTALQALDRADEALFCYKKTLDVDPDHAEAHYNRGSLLEDMGRFADAISCYERAIACKADYADAYVNMGSAFESLGKANEAIESYRKAVKIKPDYAEVYMNMGSIFEDNAMLNEALSCYAHVIAIQPRFVEAHCKLAVVLAAKGREDEAIESLDRVLTLNPDHYGAKHLLGALRGETPEAAPKQYVRELFDDYAEKFDKHLVTDLKYQAPSLLRNALDQCVEPDRRFRYVLDLGCGTGLSGTVFKDISGHLSGVDMSSKMVEEARGKKIYDDLYIEDMVAFLGRSKQKYELFIAADVFTYLGNLRPVFEAAQSHSATGAYFVLATERTQQKGYVLQKSARYAHSESYIRRLAKTCAFSVELFFCDGMRKELGKWITANYFVLKSKK